MLATKEQAGDLSQALVLLKDKGLVTKGQRIVATHGVPHATRGTNTISIVEVS